MAIILALAGLVIIVWAFYVMFSLPRKHKEFTLDDRDQATITSLGGGGTPDLTKLEPHSHEEKRRKI